MAPNAEQVERALAEPRALVRADGGDLTLAAIDAEGHVTLDLVLADASCAECVLPTDLLQRMTLSMLRAVEPGITGVTIHDPRCGTNKRPTAPG